MNYAIRTSNGLLDGVYFGEYPITKKLYFNEQTEKLEPKFTIRNFIATSSNNNGYTIFETEKEAKDYISYLLQQCEDNRTRYENCLTGITDQLIKVINRFKVIIQP